MTDHVPKGRALVLPLGPGVEKEALRPCRRCSGVVMLRVSLEMGEGEAGVYLCVGHTEPVCAWFDETKGDPEVVAAGVGVTFMGALPIGGRAPKAQA